MSNNWYSIIVNGSRHGLFHSTMGLKQEDPLLPALLILGVDVLSRLLNRLNSHPQYNSFSIEPKGPQVNHLCFVDDVILFTSRRKRFLQLFIQKLDSYEKVSDQLINKNKSHFMVPPCAFNATIRRSENVSGFK